MEIAALVTALNAANALAPLIASLIGSLRQSGETDDQVIARARATVAETRTITQEDMGPQA